MAPSGFIGVTGFVVMKLSDTVVLVDDAIEKIETVGWGQGEVACRTTCLWFALQDAWFARREPESPWSGSWMSWNRAADRAITMVAEEIGPAFVEEHRLAGAGESAVLVQWNDHPQRTRDEVMAVLRAVRQKALEGAERRQKTR